MFQDLRVVGLGAATRYQDTLGSIFSPSNFAASFKALLHPAVRDILSGFEGVVRPREMLRKFPLSSLLVSHTICFSISVVLGRPGSGCSTLLKTLANQRGEYHAVEGQVHYDSLSPEVMAKHYRGDLLYCPEDDIHFPTLTVDETLCFAAKTRIPRSRSQGKTRDAYVREMVDVLETLFGLRHAKNTPVGDSSVRGVSGGERKRVSISEALATRAMLGAWDKCVMSAVNHTTAHICGTALRAASTLPPLSSSSKPCGSPRMSRSSRQLYRSTKPASSYMSCSTRSASYTRERWRSSAPRTKRGNISSTWATSLRTARQQQIFLLLVRSTMSIISAIRTHILYRVSD